MMFQDWFKDDPITLADVLPGMLVRITKMDKLSVEKRDHLFAFGLTPGRWVEIKQHRPAVVVQVDYTELALEPEVAYAIIVDTPIPLKRMRHLHRGAAVHRRRRHRRLFFRRNRIRRRPRFFSRFINGHDRKRGKDD
jgi:Fe2+ transport system protein FeoA